MASCFDCGAEIDWQDVPGVGRVPLETFRVMRGEGRFVESVDGALVPVKPEAEIAAFQDHRPNCPAGAGV